MTISASPLTNISSAPIIQRGLDHLGKVKNNDFPSALRIISELGRSFLSIDQLTAVSKQRVVFLGNHLLAILDRFICKEPPHEVLAKIIAALANLKNALQMEVANFGWIYHPIQVYSQLSQCPKLRELQELLPVILHKIHLADVNHFTIDAEPIQRYFGSINVRGMTDEFDLFMIMLLSEYHMEGTKIIIPLSKIPRMDLLEKYLETEDVHCKLVVQILYACGLQYSLLCKHLTGNELIQKALFTVLEMTEPDSKPKDPVELALRGTNTKYNFHCYLDKKPLIPLFSAILEERDLYMARGMPSIDMLVSEDFISKISVMIGDDWLEESAQAYELIRRIEISCRKIFPKGLLGELDDLLRDQGSDEYLINRIEFMNKELIAWHGRTSPSISPEILRSGSKEQFKLFAFYQFMTTFNKKGILAKPIADEDELSVKMPAGKKPAKLQRKGGSASTTKGPDSPLPPNTVSERAPDPVKMEPPTKKASDKGNPAMGRFISEAIEKSRDFLRGIYLAPRVNAWNTSGAMGLAYYGYDSGAVHILSREEMILRHRFPPGILSLIFSNLYSKQSKIERPSGEICNHWESVLHIDGAKYMLEATVDTRGNLFHYYARPLISFGDYFHLTRESPSEFPPLERKEEVPMPLAGIIPEGITSDKQGNATFEFDGHTYKMLLLKIPEA